MSTQVFGHPDNHPIASFAHPDTMAMSVSNSKPGGTTFKFVSDGGAPQKRPQVARACESCRKRKKRCHHSSSVVLNNGHHSPSSASLSSQGALIDPPANSTGHQFPTDSGVEAGQYHTETSPATSNPVERNGHGTEPVETAAEVTEIQVCTFLILFPLPKCLTRYGTLKALIKQC